MKKILITGASGFIGSFLVEAALEKKFEVYACVRKSSNRIYLGDARIKFIELDFSDDYSLAKKIAEAPFFDFVIHNAGITKAINKNQYYISNFEYSKKLIDVLIYQNKIPEKFIYISSLAAYGPGNAITLNSIKLTDKPIPITSYGRSKLETEKYLIQLANFPYIIIRPTAVYGPRDKDLLTVFKLINNNIELNVGSKKQHLTFIYVRDLVVALFNALESDIVNKGYFVSDGNVYDSKILGSIIKEQLGKKTFKIDVPFFLAKLIAMVVESTKYITKKQTVLNFEKLNELKSVNWKCDNEPTITDLNFIPNYDLSRGVFETINWYKQNNWLK